MKTTTEVLKDLVAKIEEIGLGDDPRLLEVLKAADQVLTPIGHIETLRMVTPQPEPIQSRLCIHNRLGWCETCVST